MEYIPVLEAGFYESESRHPYFADVACPVGRGSGLENRWWQNTLGFNSLTQRFQKINNIAGGRSESHPAS